MTLLGARFIAPSVVLSVASLLQAAIDTSEVGQYGGSVTVLLVLRCQRRIAKQEVLARAGHGNRDRCGPRISTHRFLLHPAQRAMGVNNTPRTCVPPSYLRTF